MEVTWDILFSRIETDPVRYLGGYSPSLLYPYFDGYEHSRRFHNVPEISGELSLNQINQWFIDHAYAGPQGFASFCELLTDTDDKALQLFFEFRKLARKDVSKLKKGSWGVDETKLTFLELVQSARMRTRPALYFGNKHWITGIWSMWKGYIEAECDTGIKVSADNLSFYSFEQWLWERYPFAEGKNWGRLFEFLALGSNVKALEEFYDHIELFLIGGSPKDHTGRCQKFLDQAVASALKEQNRVGSE
jgi:hypothetical protein